MQSQRRNPILLVVLGSLLAACATISTPNPEPASNRPPTVQIIEAPEKVCGRATQIRLALHVSDDQRSDDPPMWTLHAEDQEGMSEGTWSMRDGPVLISFPQGEPLRPGTYTVTLSWHNFDLAEHTFIVSDPMPTISQLEIAVVPDGEARTTLDAEINHFYVKYGYDGVCLGAPYWITVQDEAGTPVCSESGVLEKLTGTGTVACYQEDGQAFTTGAYQAKMTLMEDVNESLAFAVATTPPSPSPAPTTTPRSPNLICEPAFAAGGLTPEGEPFLTPAVFDWYTTVVYVGSRCQHLMESTPWESVWYHAGEVVREASGVWEGAETGVVWDSLTGVEENPFLAPGAYTVALEIGETAPMTVTFSVYDYESADSVEE